MRLRGTEGTTPTLSDDATLSGLTVNDGTSDLTLTPVFGSGTYVYSATAGNAVTTVTLTATVNDANASVTGVTLGGTAIADTDFTDGITVPSLVVGDNVIVVTVTAEDATTQPYTVTVTRATPTVSISADKMSAVFKEDSITYTLTRTGSTTAALAVSVTLTQTKNFLATSALTPTVTIAAGQSTNTFTVAASSFQHFAAGTTVEGGTLTAAVQDGTDYDLGAPPSVNVAIVIGVMVRFDMASYTVGEADGTLSFKLIARTGPDAPRPSSETSSIEVLAEDGTASNNTDFTFVNSGLTFAAVDFSADGAVWEAEDPRTVSITSDGQIENNETFNLAVRYGQGAESYSLVDASGNSCGTKCTASVTIIDDDSAGITVSKTALTVEEEDTTGGTYTLVLNSQPTADVTITIGGQSGTDVTAGPSPLTFTPSNWNTAQTVTVTAAEDSDTTNDTVTLTHTATSTDTLYNATAASLTVTVNDDDTAQVTGLMIEPGNAQLVVQWTAVSNATGYEVQWKSGVEVYNGTRQATVTAGTTTSHTIPSLTNGTQYTVRVRATRTGANPGAYSDEEMETPVAGNTLATGAPAITGTPQVGMVLTAGIGTIADSDGLPATFPGDYTFQWVRVDADGVSNPTNKGTDSPNYTVVVGDVGKKIFVEVSFTDGGGTLEGPLPSAAYPSSGTIVSVPPALSFAGINVTVDEDAGSVTLTVELDPASTGTVTVDYATSDQNAKAGEDYTATSGTLTFTSGQTSKTITVPILNDTAYDPTDRFQVTLSNVSGATLPASPWALVTITNDDPMPTASIANVTAGEGAGTLTVTMALDRLSNEEISYLAVPSLVSGTATVTDDYVDFLSGITRTFTVPAGAMSATLDITLVDDSLDETDETIVIDWQKRGTSEATPASITFTGTITDNDTAGVTVSETALTVEEEDTTGDSYTVVLDSQPTADVTITIGGQSGTDVTAAPSPLTFTPSNWNTARTVTVTAADDSDTATDTVTLTHTATSTDPNYNATAASLTVTVNDNDTANTAPAFSSSTANRSVAENTAAGQNVGAALTATDSDGDTLTYTLEGTDAASFDLDTTTTAGSARIQTKSGVTYNHEAKSSYTVVVKADDSNGGTDTVTVTITVTDVTEAPGRPAAPSVSATSGSTTSLDVTWTAPTNTGPDIDDYDLRYREVSGGWTNGPQDVTGTSAAIGSLTASTSYQVQVRATSDEGDSEWSPSGTGTTGDGVAVRFEQAAYSVAEGGNVTVKVILSAVHEGQLDIPLQFTVQGGAESADWITNLTSVIFDSGEMENDALVFSAFQDSIDDDGESVDISFGNLPAGVTAGSPDVTTVSITDDDTAGVTISETALTVTEAELTGETYTVVLDSQPTDDVLIIIGGQGTAVTTNPAPHFTPTNWNTAQTVTVTGFNDSDFTDDTVTLTHTGFSTDSNYGGITFATVMVTAIDDDTAQVTGLMVDSGNAQLVAQWTAVANATGYEVQWKSGVEVYNGTRQATVTSGTTTSYTIPSLTNGTEYTVRVRAIRTGANSGAYSDEEMETPAAPALSFAVANITVGEDAGTATLTVELAPASTGTVTVDYATSDHTAQAGEDYTATSGTLTFTPGQTSQTITVPILNDTAYDPTEHFQVTLSNVSGATPPTFPEALVHITNDEAVPTASIANVTVGEGAGTLTVTMALDRLSSKKIDYLAIPASVSGTATVTDDYVGFMPGGLRTFTVPAGAMSATFDITLVDDSLDETDETIVIIWDRGSNIDATPTSITFTGTITDNDTAGVTVSKSAVTVTEEDTAGDTYTVVLDSQPTASVTVDVGGTSGTDVTAAPASLTFTTANWETAQEVTVTAADDSDTASDTVTLTHAATSTDTAYEGIVVDSVTVTVNDNDTANTAPAFSSSTADRSVAENTAAGQNVGAVLTATDDDGDTLTYSLEGDDAGLFDLVTTTDPAAQIRTRTGVTYNHEATPSFTVVVKAEDGNGGSDTVTVTIAVTDVTEPPGQPMAPTLTAVPGLADRLIAEWNTPTNTGPDIDTYDLRYQKTTDSTWTDGPQDQLPFSTGGSVGITGLDAGTTYRVQVRATSDEGDSEWSPSGTGMTSGLVNVRFEQAAHSVAEGGNVTVKVILSADPGRNLDIPIQWFSQGGANNADYSINIASVVFASGEMESDALVFSATQDSIDDDGESVRLSFGNLPPAVGFEAPATTTVSITDDDTAGVTVSKSAVTVTEEDTTGDTYTLVLDSQPTANVNIAIGGNSGTDVITNLAIVDFTPMNWDTARAVGVAGLDDSDFSFDTVTLTHTATSSDSNYSGIAVAAVTVTVEDNDTAQVTGLMVTPGNAQLVVQWTAVGNATGHEVQWKSGSQSYNTSGRQATVTPGTTTSYTIPSLTNGTEYTVRVRAIRTGANPGAYSDEEMETPVADTLPALSFEHSTFTVDENAGTVTITVELDPASSGTVTVDFATSDVGTLETHATAGDDYTATSGTLTFAAADTSKTFTVPILSDSAYDPSERFQVTLSNASGATLPASPWAIVRISDNSAPPTASIADVTANESAGTLTLTMALDRLSNRDVEYFVLDNEVSGTATLADDYVGFFDRTFTVPAGAMSATFDITLVDDGVAEPDETIVIVWRKVVATEATPATITVTGTITDTALPALSFPSDVTVDEDAGTVTRRVRLTPASTGTVTVDYATRTRPGGATAGEDYTTTSGTLTFAATETSKTITVPILDDDVYEDDETFLVDLSNPTGATLPVLPTTSVTIDSDEAVPTASLADVTVDEGAGTMTLTLRLSHPSQYDIAYFTRNDRVEGTATEGEDYNDFLLETGRIARITVPARSLSQTFDITLVDDGVEEPDETIIIFWDKLSLSVTTPDSLPFTGTIEDNDEGAGAAMGKPKIAGAAEVGQTLTVSTSAITDQHGNTRAENGEAGYAYTYQWYRLDAGAETPIGGALGRGSTYTLVQADEGRKFRVAVSFIDDAGNSEGPLKSNEYPPDGEEGELRLADGPNAAEGRLEVFHAGEWGTVCDDQFDERVDDPRTLHDRRRFPNIAPRKACRFMGYTSGRMIPRGTMSVAPESKPIWLDDVRCLDDEPHWTGASPTQLHHCYHAGWGNNNCGHDEDVHLSCTGPLNQTEATALTATLQDFPANHDGSGAFTFRIAFSADVTISPQDMKDHALTVAGATVTNATRVDGRSDLWEVTVEPAGTGAVSILVPQDRACTETGALCTADGQALSTGLGHSVPGPAQGQQALEPLAAGFVSVPAEHDGETEFWLELSFDAAVAQGSKTGIRALLGVSGGSVTRLRRKDGRLDHWRVRVEPSSHEAVTVTLAPSPPCGATGAVCTPDGRTFTSALATQIQGPPGLTVADAQVREAANAVLAFAVTLSRAPSGTVTVGYATSNGTATAGSDYTATSGTLSFAAGETERTVSVAVLDDAHDEGSETLTLTLSNASGAHIADGTATGTINNTDPMPKAWLARFGRTVGSQVVDALTQRLEGASGSHVTVGGIPLTGAPGAVPETPSDDPFGLPDWATRAQREESAQSLTANELLLGSAFHLSSGGGQGAGAAYTAWGRVATSGFAAEDDGVTMDAEVTSGLVGFDAEWERVLAGVMFSHSTGEGDYRLSAESGGRTGSVESSLTGVYPYARVALNARVSAWALAGAASGELTLKQEGDAPMPAGIAMRMGAAGLKGRVLDGTGASGVALDVKTDALWVGTKSEDTSELAPTEGDVTRLRVTLAGERAFAAGEGARLTPSAEVGVRHDGGDAESGTGLEVGAGLRYVAGALTVEGQVRTLVAHEDSGYQEWGVSGAVRITPSASGRGLMLSFAPQWGRTASAVQRLWSAPDASALGAGGEFEGGDARLVLDAGYGVGLGHGRGVLTPYAGLVLGDAGGRTVRTGARWQVGADAVLGLEGTRRTSGTGEAGNELMLRVALRF